MPPGTHGKVVKKFRKGVNSAMPNGYPNGLVKNSASHSLPLSKFDIACAKIFTDSIRRNFPLPISGKYLSTVTGFGFPEIASRAICHKLLKPPSFPGKRAI